MWFAHVIKLPPLCLITIYVRGFPKMKFWIFLNVYVDYDQMSLHL